MHKVYGDADAMRWVGDGKPLDHAQCEQWVEVTLRNYAVRGYGMFALVGREDGEAVGFCGLVHPGGQVEAEIKYALDREFWRRGFATEAVAGMLELAASCFALRRVIATVDPENLASQCVLRKAGMQLGGQRSDGDCPSTMLFVWDAPDDEKTV